MQPTYTSKGENRYYHQFLFLFLALTNLFNFIFLPEQIGRLVYYIIIALLAGVAILTRKRGQRNFYNGFNNGYRLILLGFCCAILVATLLEGQSLSVSIMTMIPYFTYFLYYLFKHYKINIDVVERIILSMAVIYSFIVILNTNTYPLVIFGKADLDIGRGGLRVLTPGIEFVVIAVFYFINRFLLTHKKLHLAYIIFFFFIVCLSLTRQTILLTFVLGLLFLFRKVSLFKKLCFVLIVLPTLYYTIPQIPVVKNLITKTSEQAEHNDQLGQEDIRIQGYRYFLVDGQKDIARFVFGHGKASYYNSEFGNRALEFAIRTYIYQVDVGIAGFLYDFGLIAWLGIISLLTKGILVVKSKEYQYTTYFLLYILITSFASAPILFAYSITLISAILYIIACNKSEMIKLQGKIN